MEYSIERVDTATQELVEALALLMPQLTKAPALTLPQLAQLIASPSVLLVARAPGASNPVVGMGTLGIFRTPSGQHAHIEDVIVDESFRGKGLGQAIVNALLQTAREMGFNGVSLTCNPRRVAANQLYQKMGFKKWETNVYWYGLDGGQ
jgi:ribosomal protein S18 acetylase RimI-like enzyme